MNEEREIKTSDGMGIFGRYLTVWVTLCIIIGVMIGKWVPSIPQTLSKFEYAKVSIPVAILIWLMIYPMMLKIDFSSIVKATKKPKGLTV
ncbi:arsenic resistance protein, partial [Senegalia sp. (in: firmicutes)]